MFELKKLNKTSDIALKQNSRQYGGRLFCNLGVARLLVASLRVLSLRACLGILGAYDRMHFEICTRPGLRPN